MALSTFYPEMNGTPSTQIIARMTWNGEYRVKSPDELPTGRGIKFHEVLDKAELVPQAAHFHGWHQCQMTQAAFDKFAKTHAVSVECLLD